MKQCFDFLIPLITAPRGNFVEKKQSFFDQKVNLQHSTAEKKHKQGKLRKQV